MIVGSATNSQNSDAEPVSVGDTYHMICSKKGKILEISPSVSKLLNLTADGLS